jgi:uncharacterized membrane protein (DUF2068 family)
VATEPKSARRRHDPAPGTQKPRRFLPKFHYELIACGFTGHELIGTDATEIRPEDAIIVFEAEGLRWYRCVRCDSWLPLEPPEHPARPFPPNRNEIELPLRGRPLRDKFVLRLIAVDRGFHFVVLGILAAAIFLFASHESSLKELFLRVLADFQGGLGGPAADTQHGILGALQKLFTYSHRRLYVTGAVVSVYALVEGVEAVGLWMMKRWAEYLTFVATSALLPLEIYELTHRVTWVKIVALVVNLAIVVYLIYAKRLFGLRGGAAAERAERERDSGWQALERATPAGRLLS